MQEAGHPAGYLTKDRRRRTHLDTEVHIQTP